MPCATANRSAGPAKGGFPVQSVGWAASGAGAAARPEPARRHWAVRPAMDVQADAWDFLRARDLVDDADAAEASGAGVLLTDEAREVKLENGLLFAQILKHYDVRPRPSQPASLRRAALRRSPAARRVTEVESVASLSGPG